MRDVNARLTHPKGFVYFPPLGGDVALSHFTLIHSRRLSRLCLKRIWENEEEEKSKE